MNPPELCRSIRWKSWYAFASFTPEDLARVWEANEVPYECLRTCRPWGPDEDPCAIERCQPGRECFEPSPKLVRRTA